MDKLRIGVIGVCGRGGIANQWHNNKRSEVVGGADVSDAVPAAPPLRLLQLAPV